MPAGDPPGKTDYGRGPAVRRGPRGQDIRSSIWAWRDPTGRHRFDIIADFDQVKIPDAAHVVVNIFLADDVSCELRQELQGSLSRHIDDRLGWPVTTNFARQV